jgi:hypothetical protein
MKELELKSKIENHEIENKQNELKFVGKIKKPHKGHSLFSFNYSTGEIKEASIVRHVSMGYNGVPVYKSELTKEKDCVYIWGLNKKSIIKKLKKYGYE